MYINIWLKYLVLSQIWRPRYNFFSWKQIVFFISKMSGNTKSGEKYKYNMNIAKDRWKCDISKTMDSLVCSVAVVKFNYIYY